MLAGTVVSALGLGAASLMTDLPGQEAPQAGQAVVPAGSEFNQSRDDEAAALPAPEDTTEPAEAPELAAPAPDDLSGLEGADTAPGARPETGLAEGGLRAPEAAPSESGLGASLDAPVQPSLQGEAPDAPAGEDDLSISTEPAQPAAPDAGGEASAFPGGGADGEETGIAETQPEADPAPAPEVETEAPRFPDAEAGDEELALLPEPEPEEAEKPSGTIGNMAENVETGRLPAVGVDPEPEPEEVMDAETDLRAIKAHAEPFDNAQGKPVMAVVLIDDGTSPIGLDALSAFPYPLSFAVDPTSDGAVEAMRRYREAGFEVLVMVDLPETASAADTETAMQAILTELPEAVAVMEGTRAGLQSSREAAEQLAPILLESGHGLVLFSKGLDTAGKLIAREGVPVATVFRDFDAKGQDATVIRRFLDQAAFKAGRDDDGVIMLGRLRAETVSALLIWGLQDRANQVALAPVSAVLDPEK
ncbi:divergent polysaccharide deacetylase family protein [Roseovarius sp. SCSIO 43702]|nr:divergent polysaccharide deacetylase family protein [Roseovarius sp. SCSIO 43702]